MRLSRRSYLILAAVLALGLTGAVGAAQWMQARNSVTLPAGTALHVALDHAISSGSNRAGDEFGATVIESVVVDEKAVIPAGARARGVLTDARESGRLKGVARLRLTLTGVEVNGEWYDLATSSASLRGRNHNKNNWAWIGGGAAGGTLIGALAAGGKGALIGGPVGAGAGLAGAAITGKRDIHLSAERRFTFTLAEPVSIQLDE